MVTVDKNQLCTRLLLFFLKSFNIVLLIWFSQLKCECWQKSKLSRNIDQTIFLRGQLLLFTLLKHTTFIKYICFNTFEDKWTWSTGNSIVIVKINSYFIKQRHLIYLTFKYFGLERTGIWLTHTLYDVTDHVVLFLSIKLKTREDNLLEILYIMLWIYICKTIIKLSCT